jgi:hypothetical protein
MQSALDRSHEAERAAEARAAAAEQHTAAPLPSDVRTGSVGRPNNIASVKMEELQQHLGLDPYAKPVKTFIPVCYGRYLLYINDADSLRHEGVDADEHGENRLFICICDESLLGITYKE